MTLPSQPLLHRDKPADHIYYYMFFSCTKKGRLGKGKGLIYAKWIALFSHNNTQKGKNEALVIVVPPGTTK